MTGFSFHMRDPMSSLTHGIWFLAALPLLWRLQARSGTISKRVSIWIYGLSLLSCAAGSTIFHAVQGTTETIEWYNRIDHLGIGLLIAGTFTPIAAHILDPALGKRILVMIWGAALCASVMRLSLEYIPKALATGIYLTMGWSAIPGYTSLCRKVGGQKARMIAEGGVFYTIGALIHWQNLPVLVPGYFGAHDLFHLFVMMGSFRHYQFMNEVVIPDRIDADVAENQALDLRITIA